MFSASRLYLSQVQSQLRGPLRVHGLVNSGSACRASQQNATTTTRASVPCINRWYRLVQTESGSPPGDEPPKKRKSSRKAKIEIGTPAMVGAVAESSEVPQVKKRRAKRKATGADEAVVPAHTVPLPPKTREVCLAGLDYGSVTAAVCLFRGNRFHIDNCRFFFVTSKKSLHGEYMDGRVIGRYVDSEGKMCVERYINFSDIFGAYLEEHRPESVGLENYAMSVNFRAHLIGEHHGMLKYRLHQLGMPWVAYTITNVKRAATGFGKAEKSVMVNAFQEETGWNLQEILGMRSRDTSPINDIVDAYYVCKLHFANVEA